MYKKPQGLVALNFHPTPFFLNFLLHIYFQYNFFTSLKFELFFPLFNFFVSIFMQSYVNCNLHVSTYVT